MKVLARFYNKENPFCVELIALSGEDKVYVGQLYGDIDIRLNDFYDRYWTLSVGDGEGCASICVDLIQKGD